MQGLGLRGVPSPMARQAQPAYCEGLAVIGVGGFNTGSHDAAFFAGIGACQHATSNCFENFIRGLLTDSRSFGVLSHPSSSLSQRLISVISVVMLIVLRSVIAIFGPPVGLMPQHSFSILDPPALPAFSSLLRVFLLPPARGFRSPVRMFRAPLSGVLLETITILGIVSVGSCPALLSVLACILALSLPVRFGISGGAMSNCCLRLTGPTLGVTLTFRRDIEGVKSLGLAALRTRLCVGQRGIIGLHRVLLTLGVVPRTVASSAGASHMNYTLFTPSDSVIWSIPGVSV